MCRCNRAATTRRLLRCGKALAARGSSKPRANLGLRVSQCAFQRYRPGRKSRRLWWQWGRDLAVQRRATARARHALLTRRLGTSTATGSFCNRTVRGSSASVLQSQLVCLRWSGKRDVHRCLERLDRRSVVPGQRRRRRSDSKLCWHRAASPQVSPGWGCGIRCDSRQKRIASLLAWMACRWPQCRTRHTLLGGWASGVGITGRHSTTGAQIQPVSGWHCRPFHGQVR